MSYTNWQELSDMEWKSWDVGFGRTVKQKCEIVKFYRGVDMIGMFRRLKLIENAEEAQEVFEAYERQVARFEP